MFQDKCFYSIIFCCLLVLLGGCSSSSEDEISIDYTLNFSSAKIANTDIKERRATPLKIRLYFLRSSIGFLEADFFGLQNDADKILGSDLLKTQQFFLLPDESKVVSDTTPRGTRSIGIIAEYRHLDGKIWRITLPVAEDSSWSFWTLWSGNNKFEADINASQKGLVIDSQE